MLSASFVASISIAISLLAGATSAQLDSIADFWTEICQRENLGTPCKDLWFLPTQCIRLYPTISPTTTSEKLSTDTLFGTPQRVYAVRSRRNDACTDYSTATGPLLATEPYNFPGDLAEKISSIECSLTGLQVAHLRQRNGPPWSRLASEGSAESSKVSGKSLGGSDYCVEWKRMKFGWRMDGAVERAHAKPSARCIARLQEASTSTRSGRAFRFGGKTRRREQQTCHVTESGHLRVFHIQLPVTCFTIRNPARCKISPGNSRPPVDLRNRFKNSSAEPSLVNPPGIDTPLANHRSFWIETQRIQPSSDHVIPAVVDEAGRLLVRSRGKRVFESRRWPALSPFEFRPDIARMQISTPCLRGESHFSDRARHSLPVPRSAFTKIIRSNTL
ncbi:hypothetical protein B0H13DRAFT_1877362 [Mycena leptocephala]|nr:hypothetical protein B0H13DRAFT_1877362 [Mycena leptocephala]